MGTFPESRLKELEGYFHQNKFKYIPFLSSVSTLKLLKNTAVGKDVIEIMKTEKVLIKRPSISWKESSIQYVTTSVEAVPLRVCLVEQISFKNNQKQEMDCMVVVKKMADKTSNAFRMAISAEGKENGLQPCIGVALPVKKEKENFYKSDRNLTGNCSLFSHLPLDISSLNNFHINGGFALSSDRKKLH